MAFTQGQKITASELNNINAMSYKTISTSSSGWQPDIRWYSHRPSGALLCTLRIDCGWFGGIKLRVAKTDASGNTITTVFSQDHGWSTHCTDTLYSVGPGWYRIWATEGSQIDSGKAWVIYAGQTDCTQGKKLTLYQDPYSGGNRLAGTRLTVSNLNSGLAGTINS